MFTLLLAVLFVAVTLYQRRHGGDAEVVSCEPVPGTKNNQELEESDLPPSYSRLHSGLFSLTLEDHLVPPPPYTTVLYQLGSQLADRIWRSQQQEQVDTSWQQDITSQHQADTSWQHDRTLLTADQVNITSSGWITLANSTTTTTTTTTTMSTTANLHSAPAPNISTPANRSMCTPASYQLTVCCHLMTHFEEDIFFKEGVLLNSILQERIRLFETPRSDQIIKTISYFKLWYFLTK